MSKILKMLKIKYIKHRPNRGDSWSLETKGDYQPIKISLILMTQYEEIKIPDYIYDHDYS